MEYSKRVADAYHLQTHAIWTQSDGFAGSQVWYWADVNRPDLAGRTHTDQVPGRNPGRSEESRAPAQQNRQERRVSAQPSAFNGNHGVDHPDDGGTARAATVRQ